MKILILFFFCVVASAAEFFPGPHFAFNDVNEFRLFSGELQFRPRFATSSWQKIDLPEESVGTLEISADDRNLILIDQERRLFTLFGALENDSSLFKWTGTWGKVGYPIWGGPGARLPPDTLAWASSFMSTQVDKYLLYPVPGLPLSQGNKRWIGQGVNSVYVIRAESNRITLMDPWLPTKVLEDGTLTYDESYEVCGPLDGRLKLSAIAASGSHLFVMGEAATLWTRLYDFDVAGSDEVFFRYTFSPLTKDSPADEIIPFWYGKERQLPAPDWVLQPAVPGTPTNRLAMIKTGPGGWGRKLFVEGKNNEGMRGFFSKYLFDPSWQFTAAQTPFLGAEMAQAKLDQEKIRARSNRDQVDFKVGGHLFTNFLFFPRLQTDYRVLIHRFHPYCSPAQLEIIYRGRHSFKFNLHHTHTVRFETRERGLGQEELPMYGALEIRAADWAQRENWPAWVKEFVKDYFPQNHQRFLKVALKVKNDHLHLQSRQVPLFTIEVKRGR